MRKDPRTGSARLWELGRRQCLAALLTACGPRTNGEQAPVRAAVPDASRYAPVQRLVDTFVAEGSSAGVSVGISSRSDPPVYLNAGTIALESKRRFDENSICRVYSLTKNITRIATMMLVEDGVLTLDQPVASVLPEFRSLRVAVDIDKGLESRPVSNPMTIRHLLTHTSGLGNWTPASDSHDVLHRVYRERGITPGNYGPGRRLPGYGPQAESLDDMVARLAELPLAYEPGTVYHYSVGFDVLGLVIQRASGKRFDAFLRERLFAPLDMSSTGFQVDAKDIARLTTNYDATPGGVAGGKPRREDDPQKLSPIDTGAESEWLRPPTLLAGGAGLVSTTRDFLRYADMLRRGGALGRARVMKPATARLATSDLTPPNVREPEATGTGAGSRAILIPLAPPKTFSSAGASGTVFWVDSTNDRSVVFMTQAMWGGPAKSPYAARFMKAIEESFGG
jgi:CubicO group peptidase (beta-lactamase class C family)